MEYSSYDQVPWYRKQIFCAFLGLIVFPALLPILLTGPVYQVKNGQLTTFSQPRKWLLAALCLTTTYLIIVMSVHAKPSGWGKIGEGPNLTYYADPSNVLKSDNHTTIWLLADNATVQEDNGKSYISSRQQFEIDCAGAKKRLIRYTLYPENMGKGKEIESYNIPDQAWSPIPPNTVAGSMRELACKPWWKFWN